MIKNENNGDFDGAVRSVWSDHNGSNDGTARSVRTHNDLLHKAAAARFLKISITEFKRREKLGIYVATETAGRHRLYNRDHLVQRTLETRKPGSRAPAFSRTLEILPAPIAEAIVQIEQKTTAGSKPKSAAPQVPSDYCSPKLAARIFKEFRKDEDLIRIVEDLEIAPSIVSAVHRNWIELRKQSGGFHVSGEAARMIAALDLDGFPVQNGEELAAALGAIASTAKPCSGCGKRPRRTTVLCTPCEREAMEAIQAQSR